MNNILAFRKQQRRAPEKRALAEPEPSRRAKAQSDEIDRRLREESRRRRQRPQHDVLLFGSRSPRDMVKRMKTHHGGDASPSEQRLAEFRLVIWNILLENSRGMVQVLRSLDLEHLNCSTEVRSFPLHVLLCALRWTYACVCFSIGQL